MSARVYAYALYQFFYFVQAPSTLTLCSEQVCVCVYVCTHMVSTILFGLIVHKLPLLSLFAQGRCVRVNAWLKHLFNLCVLCVCFLCFCAECVGPFF